MMEEGIIINDELIAKIQKSRGKTRGKRCLFKSQINEKPQAIRLLFHLEINRLHPKEK